MKKAGITIFTVGFDIKREKDVKKATDFLSSCASERRFYFEPDDEEGFQDAYREIALRILGPPRLVK